MACKFCIYVDNIPFFCNSKGRFCLVRNKNPQLIPLKFECNSNNCGAFVFSEHEKVLTESQLIAEYGKWSFSDPKEEWINNKLKHRKSNNEP